MRIFFKIIALMLVVMMTSACNLINSKSQDNGGNGDSSPATETDGLVNEDLSTLSANDKFRTVGELIKRERSLNDDHYRVIIDYLSGVCGEMESIVGNKSQDIAEIDDRLGGISRVYVYYDMFRQALSKYPFDNIDTKKAIGELEIRFKKVYDKYDELCGSGNPE